MALFRRRLRKSLGTDDSFVLIPLEKWISAARGELPRFREAEFRRAILARLAVCRPELATALAEAAEDVDGGWPEYGAEVETLTWLKSIQFHQRLFALWSKSRKDPGKGKEAFDGAVNRAQQIVEEALSTPGARERSFDYVLQNQPKEIFAFDWWLVAEESQRSLGMAVKSFTAGDVEAASRNLEDSIRICPDNFVAHWDMARVLLLSNGSVSRAEECYRTAARLAGDRKMAAAIDREMNVAMSNRDAVPAEIVCRPTRLFPLPDSGQDA